MPLFRTPVLSEFFPARHSVRGVFQILPLYFREGLLCK